MTRVHPCQLGPRLPGRETGAAGSGTPRLPQLRCISVTLRRATNELGPADRPADEIDCRRRTRWSYRPCLPRQTQTRLSRQSHLPRQTQTWPTRQSYLPQADADSALPPVVPAPADADLTHSPVISAPGRRRFGSPASHTCPRQTQTRPHAVISSRPARRHFLPARPANFPCLPSRARAWRLARPHGPCMCAPAGARPCMCPVDTTAQLRGVIVTRRLRRAGWAGRRRTQNNPPGRPAHVSARHRALPVAASPIT